MSKFKVGDRVRVYGVTAQDMTLTGTVTHAAGGPGMLYQDTIAVAPDATPKTQIRFHVKQCRRLKPKQRRELWIREADIPAALHSGHAIVSSAELVGDTYRRFREVRQPGRESKG